jgi:hypothetical protein
MNTAAIARTIPIASVGKTRNVCLLVRVETHDTEDVTVAVPSGPGSASRRGPIVLGETTIRAETVGA